MIRVLHYFKNINFNALVNKTIDNQGKKKYAVNIIKNHKKNYHQHISVRKFSIKQNYDNYYQLPNNNNNNNNNNKWIIIAIFSGGAYQIKKM